MQIYFINYIHHLLRKKQQHLHHQILQWSPAIEANNFEVKTLAVTEYSFQQMFILNLGSDNAVEFSISGLKEDLSLAKYNDSRILQKVTNSYKLKKRKE